MRSDFVYVLEYHADAKVDALHGSVAKRASGTKI